MTAVMHQDFSALNILQPDVEPKPTDRIPQIINLFERLIERGHAYVTNDKDVMFLTASAKYYGKLSGQHPENIKSGARIKAQPSRLCVVESS